MGVYFISLRLIRGLKPVVRSLFSLMGIELLGVAVGEAANRELSPYYQFKIPKHLYLSSENLRSQR